MLRQSSYIFVAKVLGYGLRILLPAFLVRELTKSDFGSYSQFFLIEVLFQTIFQLGVNQSQFFFIPKDPKNAGGIFLNSLLLNLCLFVMAYSAIALFRFQISNFLNMPVLVNLFWHLAAYSFLLMITVCAATYLMSRKLFKQAAVFEVATQIIVSIATLIAAILTQDLRNIILALILARLCSLIIVLVYIHLRLRGFESERYFFGIKSQILYGVTLGVSGMLWTFLMRMHELSVGRFYDLETYAVYAAGSKQIPILLFFTQSITPVALVRFAQLKADNDWEGIQKLWDKLLGMSFGFGIPLTVFVILVAKPLVTLMYTSEYSDAIIVYQLSAVAALFQLITPARVLRAMDRNDISLKVHAAVFVILPFALYIGKSIAGIYGIIGAHAFMLISARVLTLFILNKITPVNLRYFPPIADVLIFYQETLIKGRMLIERILKRAPLNR